MKIVLPLRKAVSLNKGFVPSHSGLDNKVLENWRRLGSALGWNSALEFFRLCKTRLSSHLPVLCLSQSSRRCKPLYPLPSIFNVIRRAFSSPRECGNVWRGSQANQINSPHPESLGTKLRPQLDHNSGAGPPIRTPPKARRVVMLVFLCCARGSYSMNQNTLSLILTPGEAPRTVQLISKPCSL